MKETWAARDVRGNWAPSVRDVERWHEWVDQERDEIIYRADIEGTHAPAPLRWLSPLYMPHWASRITLEVERLQEITEEDARAEGVMSLSNIHPIARPTSVFQELWDQINGKRAPWESNPWVWRMEFRMVT